MTRLELEAPDSDRHVSSVPQPGMAITQLSRKRGLQMRTSCISRTAISITQNHLENRPAANRLVLVANDGALDSEALPVHLTARQLEVFGLLCEGLPNKLICRRLNIAAGTVKTHISSILKELGVSSRLQVVVWARGRRLVDDAGDGEQDQEADINVSDADRGTHGGRQRLAFAPRRSLN